MNQYIFTYMTALRFTYCRFQFDIQLDSKQQKTAGTFNTRKDSRINTEVVKFGYTCELKRLQMSLFIC